MQDHKKLWRRIVYLELQVGLLLGVGFLGLAKRSFDRQESKYGIMLLSFALFMILFSLIKFFGSCRNCGDIKLLGNHNCKITH